MINLQDVFIIQNLSILNEGKSGGPMKIRGIFQRADEANNNQRIYPKRVLESQVRALNEAIKERRLVGELDHPTYDMVKLSNASHLITGLHLEGNEVVGEAEILPTPAGKVVEGLIRGGVKIGISSRGMGTLSEGRNGTKTVNEDFRLVTFDIVADPSTRGAYPTLAESTQLKKINKDKKIIESTIKQVVGERLFLKLLENKINQKLEERGNPNTAAKAKARKEKQARKKQTALNREQNAMNAVVTAPKSKVGKPGNFSRKHKKNLKKALGGKY